MKTSNKILFTAGAAFVLFTIGMYATLYREYDATKAYPQQLLLQLSDTPIRTLIVENSSGCRISRSIYKSEQRLYFTTPIQPETVTIQGDTLVVRNTEMFSAQLPHLEHYFYDGEPQPLPGQ